jgi:hypothetical protein
MGGALLVVEGGADELMVGAATQYAKPTRRLSQLVPTNSDQQGVYQDRTSHLLDGFQARNISNVMPY